MKAQIGSLISITREGHTYSTYQKMATHMGLEELGWAKDKWEHQLVREDECYRIIAMAEHFCDGTLLYAIVPHGHGPHKCKTATIINSKGFKVVGFESPDPVENLKNQLDELFTELVELRAFKQRVLEAVK